MSEETITTPDPTTFDIESWLLDANLPEASVDVYKGGHLIAELAALKRRIEDTEGIPDEERTAGDASAVRKLEAQYAEMLQQYADSKLTVYVSALSRDAFDKLRKDHEKKYKTSKVPLVKRNEDFGYQLLAAAIVGVRPNDGERQPVSFTAAQVKALENAIGGPQFKTIMEARQTAQNGVPEVDADFLQRHSGTSEGSPE